MAKKKDDKVDDLVEEFDVDKIHTDVVKMFGNVLEEGQYIVDNPRQIIPVSPQIDSALGGGIQEGSIFIMTGPEKVGKTVTALSFAANAQKQNRYVYYGNIEMRLKPRDLEGINGLSIDKEHFMNITSKKGNILSGEKYLSIMEQFANSHERAIGIVDSFSTLASQAELTGTLEDRQVMGIQQVQAKWCRRMSGILPISRFTIVGITHQMANVAFGSNKTRTEKTATALKYHADTKLEASHSMPIKRGENQIGQEVHWKVIFSSVGSPGTKVVSAIKYGYGVWKEYELTQLAKDFGIVKASGTWLSLRDDVKVQGLPGFAEYLEEHQDIYVQLEKEVFDMLGIAR